MGSVGNFWKNLNGGSTANEKEEDKPNIKPEDSIKTTITSTDDEIDKLIMSLEGKVKQPNEKKEEDNPISFNTDLFKKMAEQKKDILSKNDANTVDQNKDTLDLCIENEQAVQKNKEESQVDNVMETGKKATIITKSTIIAGNISTDDDLIIDGSVCGDVDCKGELTISGEVAGNAIAASINIKTSKFEGDVRSDGRIEINEGTVVLGNIYGDSAIVAGAVKGEIIVANEAKLEPTAIVKGNIRAKSVQIDHGAVLQGFCELAYESMDLDDFFGEVSSDKNIDEEIDEVDEEVETELDEEIQEAPIIETTMEDIEEDEPQVTIEEVPEEVEEEEPLLVDVGEDLEENKEEFMKEMENNYSNFMDQLKIDSDN